MLYSLLIKVTYSMVVVGLIERGAMQDELTAGAGLNPDLAGFPPTIMQRRLPMLTDRERRQVVGPRV